MYAVILFLTLLLNYPQWIETTKSQAHQYLEVESSDFVAVEWSPMQVFRPTHVANDGQEIIVSIPAGRIDAGTILGIIGPSGCGKVCDK